MRSAVAAAVLVVASAASLAGAATPKVPDVLTRPYAVAVRGGTLFVADRDGGRVVRVDVRTRKVTTVGRAKESVGVAADSRGVVHAVSGWNVVRFAGGRAVRVAGNGTRGLDGNGGPATAAQLGGAGGLGFDASGRLYIAEYDDGVRVVERNGRIRTLARDLGAPHDLAVAPGGTVSSSRRIVTASPGSRRTGR